jgi:hypothetical protein
MQPAFADQLLTSSHSERSQSLLWLTLKLLPVSLPLAKKVIDNTEVQNNARVARTECRKLLGNELIHELTLK